MKLAQGGLVAFALVLLSHAGSASAESFDLLADQGAQVSPAIIELNGEAGKSYTLDVTIMNVTGTDLSYGTEFFDFTAKDDESGSPEISQNSSLPASSSVRSWLSTLGEFSLSSNQRKSLEVKVDVPKDAEPGGHYGVIAFTGKVPTGSGERVSIRVKTGILVLVRIAGDVKESLSVASFTADSKNRTSWFIENAPIDFTVRLKNTGNVHVKPNGAIEIRNMFGGVVGKVDLNEKGGNVLPDSIRRFNESINKDWMIGRYTADLTIGYGTTGQALMSQTVFWVIPYKPLLALLALLITLGFIIKRMIKVYNKHIISEAEHIHDQDEHHEEPAAPETKIEVKSETLEVTPAEEPSSEVAEPATEAPVEPSIETESAPESTTEPEDIAQPDTEATEPSSETPVDEWPPVEPQPEVEPRDQGQDKTPPTQL